jgi:tetratricopeptide (TPR) repeat protein
MLSYGIANAQTPALTSGKQGGIHGHVQNAAGIPVSGDVKLTADTNISDTTKYKYDLPVDQNGNYKSSTVDTGTYLAVFFQQGKTIDYQNNVKITVGGDTATDFDMTRKEFMDKLTPEEKKNLEEYKKKMSATMAENSKIASLNTILGQARDAMKNKDYDTAANLMEQAVTQRPNEGLLWFEMGDAQAGQKKYDDAITSYKKAIELNDADKKPKPDLDSAAFNNMGQAQANSGKTADAAASYESAAKLTPASAGMYYFNEAAVFFNHGDTDSALAAADKAIAVDPTKADVYFIRGQSLIQKATVDEKTGKVVAPPGCAEAYQKYLELAPDGPHAKDATDVLNSLGETIHSQYKAGKKNSK